MVNVFASSAPTLNGHLWPFIKSCRGTVCSLWSQLRLVVEEDSVQSNQLLGCNTYVVCIWACPAWGSTSRQGEVILLFCKHVTTFHLFTTYAALCLVFIYFCPMWNSCYLLRCWQCFLKAAGFQSLSFPSKAAATSLVCICVGTIRILVQSVTCASGTQMLLSDGSRTPLHAS